MKYFIAIFVTAVIVFLGATIYYKGLPNFSTPSGVSVTNSVVITTPTITPSASPVTEDLAAIMKALLIKKYGPNASNMNVTVSLVEGEYAKGMVTENGGGGMWFAARQNGTWTLVWDGNGIITCEEISPFPNFPVSMIPSCWDKASDKTVTR